MGGNVELALDAKAALGEGAIWHARGQVLFWVDITDCSVHVYDPAAGTNRRIPVGEPVGTIVPRRSGGAMIAVKRGFASLDLRTGEVTIVADPERHLPDNRFNDGKCDPAGRFWAGTMAMRGESKEKGSLYCLFPDQSVRRMLDRVTTSNGIVWSHDRATMYYIDTPTMTVSAFDYDASSAAVSNRRTAIAVPKEMGYPDGMTIDAEGMLWIAHWGGSRVTRWDPKAGRHLQSISVPSERVTSCAFGGPGLSTLYITTARSGLDEAALAEQPHAGGVFRVEPGVPGVEAFEFAG